MSKFILAIACFLSLAALQTSAVQAQWLEEPSSEPKEDGPQQYFEWFYGCRTFGLGYIPEGAWLRALNQRDSMRQRFQAANGLRTQPSSIQAQITWQIVGPLNVQSGGSVPNHAGRVNSIACDPTNSAIAYLGSAAGGIWKTTNSGHSWKPLSDFSFSLATGAIAIDPSNHNILYVGTGEANPSIDRYFGAGIMKSADGGTTWQPSGLANVGAFSKLIVNPNKSSTIYAAAAGGGGGLYISTNSGATWAKTSGDLPPGDVTDLVYGNNGSSDVLYVGIPSHGVFRSIDGGQSWINVFQAKEMRRVNLGIDPNNWKDVVVLSANFNGGFETLQRTVDGGALWDDISGNLGQIDIFSNGSGNPQGWYDAYVVRDPLVPGSILVGGISIWKTADGGASWSDVGLAYKNGGIHPDQHHAAFGNPGSEILYAASDGGIAVSLDRGDTFEIYDDSLAITQSYGIAIDQAVPDITYTGNQDNGTLVGGRAGDWAVFGGGDGGTVSVDSKNHNNVYFIIPGTLQVHPNNSSGLGSGTPPAGDSVGWIIPIAQDEVNHILYTASQYLYVQNNGSASWTKRNKKLAYQSYISTIAPAGDGKTLMIGTTGGKIWSTIDNGVKFIDCSSALPGRSVECIKASPTDTKTFYATLSGFGAAHVLKTTDLGQSWQNISTTLPDIPCNAIVVDEQHPTNLYLGTDVGVFFSPDDGINWLPFGTGLPNTPVTDLAYHKTSRALRAGTHGRSLWEATMTSLVSGITTPTVSNIWYIGESAQIGWYGVASPVLVEISFDNAGSWVKVADAATGSIFTIGSVHFPLCENALVRVTGGAEVVQSQMFRIRQRTSGTTLTTFSEQPLYMYDLAYDKDDDILFATSFTSPPTAGDPNIYKIDPTSGQQVGKITVSGGGYFTGIKYDPETKHTKYLDNKFLSAVLLKFEYWVLNHKKYVTLFWTAMVIISVI
ncbi:MAG: hypothetical protein ABI778_04790, partial [Ignavibacteriota bacterium]